LQASGEKVQADAKTQVVFGLAAGNEKPLEFARRVELLPLDALVAVLLSS
jgi:hypothetical protein